jgi:hypothetical protein
MVLPRISLQSQILYVLTPSTIIWQAVFQQKFEIQIEPFLKNELAAISLKQWHDQKIDCFVATTTTRGQCYTTFLQL